MTTLTENFGDDASLYPWASQALRRLQVVAGLLGAAATVLLHGQHSLSETFVVLLQLVVWISLATPLLVAGVRHHWSRKRATFLQQHRFDLAFSGVWLVGMVAIPLISDWLSGVTAGNTLLDQWFRWSELMTIFRGLHEVYYLIHQSAAAGLNPALVLVMSFATLIAVGTILLMLPRCRPEGEPAAPFLKALFTATSAGCVTGLVLDPPGEYWSRTGQVVLLGLIQLGGLGIMTFGAFFALVLGRRLPVREQITFRELLDSDRIGDVGGIVRAILGLTLGLELIGALLLSTLWPDLPWSERLFQGLFHAVSAFCNAGFCLRTESLIGWEQHWQVWAVVPLLIIAGGFGFNAIDNWRRVLNHRWLRRRAGDPAAGTIAPRLSLTTRLVTITTLCLLVGGTGLLFLLEFDNSRHPEGYSRQFINAWFHSVTLRTAGFSTIDHEHLRPATKLVSIAFMFIGASPGSAGGGVKTICLALMVITLRSVLRGRPAVETGGRTVPDEQVFRGLAIISLGLLTLMLVSLLLVFIENQPERLIDQLYEAASAFGTVGLSANLTHTLKPASQVVLVIAMFLGRVGPLTLIVALSSRRHPRGYAYPEERLALG